MTRLLAGAFCLLWLLLPAGAHPQFEEAATPLDVAHAASANPSQVPNAAWFYWPPGAATNDDRAAGTFTGTWATMPAHGPHFGVMSSGRAGSCFQSTGPQSETCSRSNGGSHNGAFDSVVLAIQINVPDAHNHVSVDYQFCSEEYPEWVGTQYNDGMFLEWDVHSWAYSGGTVTAPHNFAYDQTNNLVTINVASMDAANGAGTAWDGCTCKLTSYQETTPGLHTLYVSVTDASDSILDTGHAFDAVRTLYRPTTPETACNVLPPPLIFTWTPDPPLECLPVTFTIVEPIPQGGFTVTWDFGDGTIASTNELDIEHQYANDGIYPVSVQLYDMSTSETLYGAADVEVIECSLVAEANGPYVETELISLPILGEAYGYLESYTCQWSTTSPELVITSPGSCEASVVSDTPGDYIVKLAVYDPDMEEHAFDTALVRILPTPPDSSEDEAGPDRTPRDGVDPRRFQADTDGDGIPDGEDLCPNLASDHNRDLDQDGIANDIDRCPAWFDPLDPDADGDGHGDGCDIDDDADGITDGVGHERRFLDNCPFDANVDQADLDGDGLGDACDPDHDGDGILDLQGARPGGGATELLGGRTAGSADPANKTPVRAPFALGIIGFLAAVALVALALVMLRRSGQV